MPYICSLSRFLIDLIENSSIQDSKYLVFFFWIFPKNNTQLYAMYHTSHGCTHAKRAHFPSSWNARLHKRVHIYARDISRSQNREMRGRFPRVRYSHRIAPTGLTHRCSMHAVHWFRLIQKIYNQAIRALRGLMFSRQAVYFAFSTISHAWYEICMYMYTNHMYNRDRATFALSSLVYISLWNFSSWNTNRSNWFQQRIFPWDVRHVKKHALAV